MFLAKHLAAALSHRQMASSRALLLGLLAETLGQNLNQRSLTTLATILNSFWGKTRIYLTN